MSDLSKISLGALRERAPEAFAGLIPKVAPAVRRPRTGPQRGTLSPVRRGRVEAPAAGRRSEEEWEWRTLLRWEDDGGCVRTPAWRA